MSRQPRLPRLPTTFFLAASLSLAATARAADRPWADDGLPPQAKTVIQAYSALLIGTAGPILLGSALIAQGGSTNETIGGWLIAEGIFVGPSTGQFYAESYGTGVFSTGLRVGGAALTIMAFMASYGGSARLAGSRPPGAQRAVTEGFPSPWRAPSPISAEWPIAWWTPVPPCAGGTPGPESAWRLAWAQCDRATCSRDCGPSSVFEGRLAPGLTEFRFI